MMRLEKSYIDDRLLFLAEGYRCVGHSWALNSENTNIIEAPNGVKFHATNRSLREVNRAFNGLLTDAVKVVCGEVQEPLLVDLGCGTEGCCLKELVDKFNGRIKGVGVDVAVYKDSTVGKNVKLKISEVGEIDLPSETADIVYSRQLLPWLDKKDTVRAIRESIRICRGVCLLDIEGDNNLSVQELLEISQEMNSDFFFADMGLFRLRDIVMSRLKLMTLNQGKFLVIIKRNVNSKLLGLIEGAPLSRI